MTDDKGTDRYKDILCPDCREGLLHPEEDESGEFWRCENCRRTFANAKVEQLVPKRVQRDVESGVRYSMRIDRKKAKGKGRSSKSHGKDDKLKGTSLKHLHYDDSIAESKVRSLDPKSCMMTFRGMPEDVTSDTLRVALFLYCQFRDQQRAAEAEQVNTYSHSIPVLTLSVFV